MKRTLVALALLILALSLAFPALAALPTYEWSEIVDEQGNRILHGRKDSGPMISLNWVLRGASKVDGMLFSDDPEDGVIYMAIWAKGRPCFSNACYTDDITDDITMDDIKNAGIYNEDSFYAVYSTKKAVKISTSTPDDGDFKSVTAPAYNEIYVMDGSLYFLDTEGWKLYAYNPVKDKKVGKAIPIAPESFVDGKTYLSWLEKKSGAFNFAYQGEVFTFSAGANIHLVDGAILFSFEDGSTSAFIPDLSEVDFTSLPQ